MYIVLHPLHFIYRKGRKYLTADLKFFKIFYSCIFLKETKPYYQYGIILEKITNFKRHRYMVQGGPFPLSPVFVGIFLPKKEKEIKNAYEHSAAD